jgi:hypothetical protein
MKIAAGRGDDIAHALDALTERSLSPHHDDVFVVGSIVVVVEAAVVVDDVLAEWLGRFAAFNVAPLSTTREHSMDLGQDPNDSAAAERPPPPTNDWSSPAATPFELTPAEPPHRRRLGWIVGASAIVCALVATLVVVLGSSSDSPSATTRILAAASRNEAAGPAHFTAVVILRQGGQQQTAMKMHGDQDPAAKTARITLDAAGSTSEIRMIDGIEYFSSPLAKLPDGKKWVKIDPAAVGITPAAAAPNDPMAQLALLGGLVGTPTVVGSDTIDGDNVTRYDVTLDFTKVVDELTKGATALGSSDSFLNGLKSLGAYTDLQHIPGHVALDDQGRARAFSLELHLDGPKGSLDETLEMSFSDFGTAVSVETPPEDQVVPFSDVPDVFKNMTGG